MRTLIVSPHPDDAEIALGAAIYDWTSNIDHSVDIAVCTGEGDLVMEHSGKNVPFSQRKDEQVAACKVLNVSELHWLNFARAANFDGTPIRKLVGVFDRLFGGYDRVFVPMPSINQDHRVTWEASMATLRLRKLMSTAVFAYEQPTQTASEHLWDGSAKAYISVSCKGLKAQKKALLCHESQINGRAHTLEGFKGVRQLATLRGMECGSKYAAMVYPIRFML